MKKIILGIILFVLAGYAGQIKFTKELTSLDLGIKRNILVKGKLLKTIKGSITRELNEKKGDNGSVIDLSGCTNYSSPTAPLLPQKNIHYKLKGRYDISSVVLKDGVNLKGKTNGSIIPANENVEWNNANKFKTQRGDVYKQNAYFPNKWLSYTAGYDGKYTHVYIHVLPVHWNPLTQDILLLSKYSIDIYGEKHLNLQKFKSVKSVSGKHIILSPSDWINTADSIAAFHNAQGVSTDVVDISTIYANYTAAENPTYSGYANLTNPNIQNYEYENAKKLVSYFRDNDAHPNLELITVLGAGHIIPPSYYFKISIYAKDDYNDWTPSDHYYSSPDYDFVDNFGLNRISVFTKEELSSYYHKMMNWTNSWGGDWTTKASVAGGLPFQSSALVGELISNQVIRENLFSSYDVEKYYLSTDKFTASKLRNHLKNDDFLWHFHISHGGGDKIYFDDYSTISATEMLNYPQKDKLSIFLSVACMNGAFDTHVYNAGFDKSFAEGLVASKGAGIAYIGGSRSNGGMAEYHKEEGNLVYTGTNDTYALLYNYIKNYRNQTNPTFGSVFKAAKDTFLLEEDMGSLANVAAYVRFVGHCDAGLKFPPSPQFNSNLDFPLISLDDNDGFEGSTPYKHIIKNETLGYTVNNSETYSMEAYKFIFNSNGDVTGISNIGNENSFNSQFSLDYSFDIGEYLLLNKVVNPNNYKEAWHYSKIYQEEDFAWIERFDNSSQIPQNWLTVDNNQDGNCWEVKSMYQNIYAHSGSNYAMINTQGHENDDWLIAPAFGVGSNQVLKFYARSRTVNPNKETFEIRISENGTAIENFTFGFGDEQPYASWKKYEYNLNQFTGKTINIAIQCKSNDKRVLYIDDFGVLNDDTGIENSIISTSTLEQNYPNPFNPTTTIKYSLVNNSEVKIKIFNIIGKEVASLVNCKKNAGTYTTNFNGAKLSSGIYIYSLILNGKVAAQKRMMLIK